MHNLHYYATAERIQSHWVQKSAYNSAPFKALSVLVIALTVKDEEKGIQLAHDSHFFGRQKGFLIGILL